MSRIGSFSIAVVLWAIVSQAQSAPQTSGASAQEPNQDTPAQQSSPPKPMRIRIAGNVQQAQLTRQVMPVYPPEAKAARISGTVVLHAVIARDGTIEHLEDVSGPPMLTQAAMNAVQQWHYKPTLLNGEPVEVDTTITVIFTLGEGPPASGGENGGGLSTAAPASSASPGPPPTHPAALRLGLATFADTPDGIKEQLEAALNALRSGDKAKFDTEIDSFALVNPKAWLTQTFGPEKGAALVLDYETSLGRFKAHIQHVGDPWGKSTNPILCVEYSEVPRPMEETSGEPLPPRPIVPPHAENFRFSMKTGLEDPPEWVFSFIYLDGSFRILGGTYTFWDDNWRSQRAVKTMEVYAAAHPPIEGVDTLCSGDGLIRVFVSPKVQQTRLQQRVEPTFPEEAKKAGIEGLVLFHAIIAADGSVKELELEDGDPILAKAAEEAVRKWRYSVTVYHDRSEGRDRIAEVDTAIAVMFKLHK